MLIMVILIAASVETSELLQNVPSPTPRSYFLVHTQFLWCGAKWAACWYPGKKLLGNCVLYGSCWDA